MHFLRDKMENNLRIFLSHLKGHVRVRYGLVPANYAMIRVLT
jgi:hypothetical protein